MNRLLAAAIFAYAILSAAQWRHASWWLYAPDTRLWCGNVISDPFLLLVDVVGPTAALCTVALALGCCRARQWPVYAVTAFIAFVVTSAGLAYEAHVLGPYGINFGHAIWWLPWV